MIPSGRPRKWKELAIEGSEEVDLLASASRTFNPNSSSESLRSSASMDPNAYLQRRDGQSHQRSEQSYFREAYRRCRDHLASSRKPGFRADLAYCAGVISIGTLFMMYSCTNLFQMKRS